MKRVRYGTGFVLVAAALLASACVSMGPNTIPRDQFDYGAAIANSGKNQLLFNVVRLRYVEAPVFVEVSSVINQYSLEGEVALGGGMNTSVANNNTMTVGGAGRYADRPTITYTPIAGQKFASSLLTPIAPEHLFALVQAGWPTEVILRLTVRSINGLENEWASPAHRKQADPRFTELLHAWSRLRVARAIGLRREGKGGEAQIIVYQSSTTELNDEVKADLSFLQEVLGLDPEAREYRLSYGLVPDKTNEIVVLTSSIMVIMNELAWRIDIPPGHIEEGRTGTTFTTESADTRPLIRVHYAKDRPDDCYVTVRNRDFWFYIDDRDVVSKRTFAMLQIILSMTDSGDKGLGPVVSISN